MKTPQAISVSNLSRIVCLPSLRTKLVTLLAVMVFSSLCANAATGSLYATNLNVPVGILWLGSTETLSGVPHGHVWAADAGGFCRIDDDGNGNATLTANCAPGLPGAINGPADWDPATNTVYIPTAAGIARYSFNPSLADPTQESLVGPTGNLGQPAATTVAFGPDGKLYFASKKGANIQRLTTPGGAAQTVETVGVTAATHPGAIVARTVFGMSFQGSDLMINAANFLQRISFAPTCNGACEADNLNITIAAVGSNSTNLALFAPQGVSLNPTQLSEVIDQYSTVTGSTDQLSTASIICGVPYVAYSCPADSTIPDAYAAVVGMTVDQYNQAVYIVDDTSAGVNPSTGRVIRIAPSAPGVLPTVDSTASFINPISASAAPAVPGRSGFLLTNAGLTAPGVVVIGPNIWALDRNAGICRIDLGVLNPATCIVLGGIPGQSVFDPTTNFLYVPDKAANSRGVWRVPYNPVTNTLNGVGATLVAANKGLGGNQPLCAVLGPDGSLYVSFNKNGNILRITTPATNTNTVSQVGQSTDGHAVFSLAWISKTITDGFGNQQTQNSMYMLQTTALTWVIGADAGTKVRAAFITPVKVANPAALVSDKADVLYIAQGGEIDTFTVSTQTEATYSTGTAGPPVTFFGKITGLDIVGPFLIVGDDATGSGAVGQGRIWID